VVRWKIRICNPMRFEFATATRIVFGRGTLKEAGPIAKEMGCCALLVTGANPCRAELLPSFLAGSGVDAVGFSIIGEPRTSDVVQGVARARRAGCDLVISFGGGSAIDAGKAIAAMLTNEGELFDYLEVIGQGRAIAKAPAPFLAIPTTAGTGTEVTRNAVLASPEHQVKVSLRSPLLLAKVALVDPDLTLALPRALTASTGLDALTQLIEPYVCCRPNPLVDALCIEGLRRAARSLHTACEHGDNTAAREDMCVASLFGGLALANAGLGAVHGFAAPIGGSFPAPHGAVCAALLPHVMRANLCALRARAPQSQALARYTTVARILTGQANAKADDGADWVARLTAELNIPPLRGYGIQASDFPALVAKSAQASSMKANPIPLTAEESTQILTGAW
jgi:alcohol dehydrogenase class IV